MKFTSIFYGFYKFDMFENGNLPCKNVDYLHIIGRSFRH